MKKILLILGLIAVIGLVLVIVGRNFIARKSVEMAVGKTTGFPLSIGSVNVGLFDGQLEVTGLKLMNPPDFEAPLFVDLPQFHLTYELGSFLHGVPHVPELTIKLDQIVIVKNAHGESNVQRLEGLAGSSTNATPANKASSPTHFKLDLVHLHIGTVTIKDYSGGTLSEHATPLNIDVTYKNISDSTDISRLVLMTIMSSRVRLPDIGVRMGDLQKNLGSVQQGAGAAVNVLTNATKGLFDKLKPQN